MGCYCGYFVFMVVVVGGVDYVFILEWLFEDGWEDCMCVEFKCGC